MRTFNALRQLAKSNRWQIVYSRSKELSGIKLFSNEVELTPLQLAFLQWLEIYHSLEVDLATKEKGISRDVIEDDYRVDAYLYCREHKDKNKGKSKEPKEGYEAPMEVPGVVFRKGK